TSYPIGSTLPQLTTFYADALGRPRYEVTHLGDEYANHTLVSSYVEYDSLGRPAYEASPFEAGTSFSPTSLGASGGIPYPQGVSFSYDDAGRLVRTSEAPGHASPTDSSVAADAYV